MNTNSLICPRCLNTVTRATLRAAITEWNRHNLCQHQDNCATCRAIAQADAAKGG